MRVIKEDRHKVPIKIWATDIEESAMEQIENVALLPFLYKQVSFMPDCHAGMGVPIGSVVATTGVVLPAMVGVDIGCGMAAVRTSLTDLDMDAVKAIMGDIRQLIPVGFDHHTTNQKWDGFDNAPDLAVIEREWTSAHKQLGTLGGGNHFWEIQKGSDGFIWVMIHSGSRNFGLKIAHEYHDTAKWHCEKWHSAIPDKDLAFFPIETKEAKDYLMAMNYALQFARENRNRMIEVSKSVIAMHHDGVLFAETLDVHHNYAVWEHHFGQNVIVHRKGAISAREGQLGIIPGSQGTKSYIVKGKGNPESFTSCSHGAGRKMGRKMAQKTLVLADEKRKLDEKGIVHSVRNTSDLDEAPGAYKDIDIVMADQADLVEIVTELTPLGVIKG